MSEMRRVSIRDYQTTDATPALVTLTEIEDDSACTILAWVVAKQQGSSNSHMWLVGNGFVCSGGTLVEVGGTNRFHDVNTGLAGATIDINATSTTYIDIRMAGVAATTIDWCIHAMCLVLKLT